MQLTRFIKTIGVSKTASNLIISQETGHFPSVFKIWKLTQLDLASIVKAVLSVMILQHKDRPVVSWLLENTNALGLPLSFDELVQGSFTAHYLPLLVKHFSTNRA